MSINEINGLDERRWPNLSIAGFALNDVFRMIRVCV